MGSCFGVIVHTWGVRVKGPVYIALFKPFAIVIAAVTGFIFLGESLYLGRYKTITSNTVSTPIYFSFILSSLLMCFK